MIFNVQINIILVFFIHGLFFFSLGVAMMLESGRSPLLVGAKVLIPLAFFGLLQGTHEWLEIGEIYTEWFVPPLPTWFIWLRMFILTLSFSSLMMFALVVLQPQSLRLSGSFYIAAAILIVFLITAFFIGLYYRTDHLDWHLHIENSIRFLLGIPASILAGIALYSQSILAGRQRLIGLKRSLQIAALGFLFYAFTQTIVSPLDTFPGKYLNTTNFFNLVGVPIQVLRSGLALVITISLLRAIQFAEEERKKRFIEAQQARVDALEQIQQELVEREQLRQRLLRHTVDAQEDERARIARELHDETAQVLTALSLHLTSLEDSLLEDGATAKKVDQLKELCGQMTQDIYRLIRDLRPVQLDELGLYAALQFLVDESYRQMDLQVELDVTGIHERLDPYLEIVLFRVAQEALTNISRHAGVSKGKIGLNFNSNEIVMQVCDQGQGFALNTQNGRKEGWGLAGMRERVESVDGKIHIQSNPGEGTAIEIRIPYYGNVERPKNAYKSLVEET